MKVVLFRSNNLLASRCNKYVNFYKRACLDYKAVGWDRKGNETDRDNYEFFHYKAGVRIGGVQAMKNHFHWMKFVYNYMKSHPEITTVHACDMNSAFPVAVFKSLHNKKLRLIFDVCDWFSANFGEIRWLKSILVLMEKYTCKYADEVIICEPERIKQIPFPLKKEPLVLPNIPEIGNDIELEKNEKYMFNNNNITLAYFGNFTLDRYLLEILELAKSQKFNLLIAGYGSSPVEKLAEELNERCRNVKYFGKVDMLTGLTMSKHADAIFAFYCLNNPNHKFAAPNKYYESMYLGLPIITNEGTILADAVKKNNIGFVLPAKKEDVVEFIQSVTKEQLARIGCNSRIIWDLKYYNYVNEFFNTIYNKVLV